MNDNIDSVMRRIEKLLAMANDGRGNPEEAATAAAMATKLMAKYQIDHADVITAKLKAGSGMATRYVVVTAKTNGTAVEACPRWAQWIAAAIGNANDCRTVLDRNPADGQVAVCFMGFEADVEVAAYLMGYLAGAVNRLCVAYRASPAYLVGGRSTMNAYRTGVALAISGAVRRLGEQARAAAESTGRALVVAKAAAIAEHFGEPGKPGKVTKLSVKDRAAFNQGSQDGSRVDVNRRGLKGNTGGADTLAIGHG